MAVGVKGELRRDELMMGRNFASCMSAAFGMLFDNIGVVLRRTWAFALAFAVLSALSYVLYASALTMDEVGVGMLVALVALGLLTIVAAFACCVAFVGLLNGRPAKWNARRCLAVALCLLALGVVAVLVAAGAFLAVPASGIASGVAAALSFVAVSLLELPYLYSLMKYLMDGGCGIGEALLGGWRVGMRHWGHLFVTALVGGLCTGLCALVVSMPMAVAVMAHALSIYGVNFLGDDPGLPAGFAALQFFASLFVSFILVYVNAYMAFVLYYAYGDIEMRHGQRMEFLATHVAVVHGKRLLPWRRPSRKGSPMGSFPA